MGFNINCFTMNDVTKPKANLKCLVIGNSEQQGYFCQGVHVASSDGCCAADSSPFKQSEDEILDKPGASKLLKISIRTLDDWMRKKRIPYSKLPSGTVRFRRSQLLAFITKYEVA
jgi:predicted DNA-binding transcriptional regulator AlpA